MKKPILRAFNIDSFNLARSNAMMTALKKLYVDAFKIQITCRSLRENERVTLSLKLTTGMNAWVQTPNNFLNVNQKN